MSDNNIGTEKQEMETETTAGGDDNEIKKGEATFHARQSGRVGSSIETDHVRIFFFLLSYS